MKANPRDRLELLKFNAVENTVGTCLRAIIRRLQARQEQKDRRRRPAANSCAAGPAESE
jgi:hypothetical protein